MAPPLSDIRQRWTFSGIFLSNLRSASFLCSWGYFSPPTNLSKAGETGAGCRAEMEERWVKTIVVFCWNIVIPCSTKVTNRVRTVRLLHDIWPIFLRLWQKPLGTKQTLCALSILTPTKKAFQFSFYPFMNGWLNMWMDWVQRLVLAFRLGLQSQFLPGSLTRFLNWQNDNNWGAHRLIQMSRPRGEGEGPESSLQNKRFTFPLPEGTLSGVQGSA